MHDRIILHTGATLLALAWAAPALADKDGTAAPAQFAITHHALPVPRLPPVVPRTGPPPGALDDARLDALRGGTETPVAMPWSDMKLQGTVSGNAATEVVSGANTVAGGAFANAAGLPMVIQNSGANVLIQNATIVNVQFR